MKNNSDFETFFIISLKIILSANKINNFELIFKEEMIINNFLNELILEHLIIF